MSMLRRLVAATALLCAPSLASAALFTGFDAMTSTVFQKNQTSFSGVAIRGRIHPERMVKEFEILPTFEHWRSKATIKLYDIEASRSDAALGADVRYRFPGETWRPYFGIGYFVHFQSTEVDAPTLGLNDASDSVTNGAVSGMAGISFPLTERIENFIEAKYHHVSENRQFKFNWGISFNMK